MAAVLKDSVSCHSYYLTTYQLTASDRMCCLSSVVVVKDTVLHETQKTLEGDEAGLWSVSLAADMIEIIITVM
jgi:hypothetical protein